MPDYVKLMDRLADGEVNVNADTISSCRMAYVYPIRSITSNIRAPAEQAHLQFFPKAPPPSYG